MKTGASLYLKTAAHALTAISLSVMILTPCGCVITTEGMEEKEIILDELFPPSKTVASYRQVVKPAVANEKLLTEQLGDAKKYEMLKRWGAFSSKYCDFGLPDKPPKVRVTITELTFVDNAFGAYSNLRPGMLPASQYLKIGIHATLDRNRLIFVQHRYLICVRDLDNTPEDQQRALLINFASSISKRMPRGVNNIRAVSILPSMRSNPNISRVPASERLDKEDPLGLGIFDAGNEGGSVSAIYKNGEREVKVFIAAIDDKEKSKSTKAWNALIEAMKKNGETKDLPYGESSKEGILLDMPAIVAQREGIIFGVVGNMDLSDMQEMVYQMDRNIKPIIPQEYKEKDSQKK